MMGCTHKLRFRVAEKKNAISSVESGQGMQEAVSLISFPFRAVRLT
jgi:hypothetical protein